MMREDRRHVWVKRGWARWGLAALVVLPLMKLLPAAAAHASGESPRLEIVVVGSTPATELLAATIAPLLPATLAVDWRSLTNDTAATTTLASHPGARIWIDARSSGKVQVVAFRRDAVPRVRTVDAPDLTPVVAETVGQITRETAFAVLAEAASTPPAGREDGALPAPPVLPPAGDRGPSVAATVAAAAPVAAPSRNLLLVANVIVRDEYGLGAEAAYGGAVSAAYLFRPAAAVRPYLALSLGLFGDGGFGVTAMEAVETMGISWQVSSLVDLSVGLGGGVVDVPNAPAFLIGRGTASLGLRLGASIEQIFTATLDAGQAAHVTAPWPAPNRIAPGLLIGLGWRPRW
jgi:hypothetical protein